jgi:Domain of unknown function (DUF1929)
MATISGAGIDPQILTRILKFLNTAGGAVGIAAIERRSGPVFDDPTKGYGDQILDYDIGITVAQRMIDKRTALGPGGFTNVSQLSNIDGFGQDKFDDLVHSFGPAFYGNWITLPYQIKTPLTNGGLPQPVEVVHAALLFTGKVVFIPADFQNANWPTPIWDPSDEVNPLFEYPVINPEYSLLCSGHAFLSDGKLLVVGGGGDHNVFTGAFWGFKLDPVAKTWTRTTGPMAEYRWYPTAIKLGDQGVSATDHRVLICCGHGIGDMEIYDEGTDSFTNVTGDDKTFFNLYPGLHLLPNHSLFFSRTGWGSATSGAPAANEDSAYFTFSGANAGAWTHIVPSTINRCKGMSVVILQNNSPTVRVMVVGGSTASGAGINSAEVINLSSPSSGSAWAPTGALSDSLARRQCNAVLLPDNTVFVAGGVISTNTPCMMYNPPTNAWAPMDELPSIRGYHSVMMLLPSGKVMMAGGTSGEGNPGIEIYSPPYLFRGARPVISTSPPLVHHGETFTITTPDAASITRVVFARPSAVTHQTDTEQRMLSIPFTYDSSTPTTLTIHAPDGGHPHSYAPQGYYMMFILNGNMVPSVAKWIYLH